jgi:tetratricopeptide (TPR) repeat protein
MLRLIAFFVLAVVLANLLGQLPLIGGFFRATGVLGVWITALLLAWGISKWGARAVRVRRDAVELRRLVAVDNPHNHGKAGSILLAQGKTARAYEHLRQAAAGEPDNAEWCFRLGQALLARREPGAAVEAFERTLLLDPEYGYGNARLGLAQARAALGEHDAALNALAALERDHGPSPEQAYRRGTSLRALGRRDEARAAFAEVVRLAGNATKYQRREAAVWAMRARLGGLL